MLMCNFLAGWAPSYLGKLFVSVSSVPGRRFLYFFAHSDLDISQPELSQSSTEDRSFAVVGPTISVA